MIPGLPAVRTGKAEIVSVEATPAQQAIMADFILRAEAIRTGRVKPEEDNMLLPVFIIYCSNYFLL